MFERSEKIPLKRASEMHANAASVIPKVKKVPHTNSQSGGFLDSSKSEE